MKKSKNAVIIGGTSSSVGKTTAAMLLMLAFSRKGYYVQGFKVGPDFIDPGFHQIITGRPSVNLDPWMMGTASVRNSFLTYSDEADVSVIEGVMGMFDGKSPGSDVSSTSHVSRIIGAPVLLVIDGSGLARSSAALVSGFAGFDDRTNIRGVVVNRIASDTHLEIIRHAIWKYCGLPVSGHIKNDERVWLPERHLGLVPAMENKNIRERFERLLDDGIAKFDLNAISKLSAAMPVKKDVTAAKSAYVPARRVRIGVALDNAFNFYYADNLRLLEDAGAELVFFSPLSDAGLPRGLSGLYIGGGFPEVFSKKLSSNKGMINDVKKAIERGMPTYAECGGHMYLSEKIIDNDGAEHGMVGIVPGVVKMNSRMAGFGYREVTAKRDSLMLLKGENARGHEFHYSDMDVKDKVENAYTVTARGRSREEGVVRGNLLSSYVHIHFLSNKNMPRRFVSTCHSWQRRHLRGRTD